MMRLGNIHAGYGETRVLHGVDLVLKHGEVHCLLGRNGVGKSTLLKTIMGFCALENGDIFFEDQDITSITSFERARLGMAYVPETRDIFTTLSVKENLLLAERLASPNSPWTLEAVLALFPNLQSRLENGGDELSGGEKQMLAIARALMSAPKVLLLDDPTEGLAPKIAELIYQSLHQLKSQGMTVLLIEQNLRFATQLADQISILSRGKVVWQGTPATFQADQDTAVGFLGL